MKEKNLKEFYNTCSKAIAKHCEKNKIEITEIECKISENSKLINYYFAGKIIMTCNLIEEPQIKIKKIKP